MNLILFLSISDMFTAATGGKTCVVPVFLFFFETCKFESANATLFGKNQILVRKCIAYGWLLRPISPVIRF